MYGNQKTPNVLHLLIPFIFKRSGVRTPTSAKTLGRIRLPISIEKRQKDRNRDHKINHFMRIAVVEAILKVLLQRETNVTSISYTRRFIATWSAINSNKHIHLFLVFYSQSITWGLNNIQRNLIDRIWTKDTRMTQSKLNHWATRCQWDGERPKWLREVPATFFKKPFRVKKNFVSFRILQKFMTT